MKETFSFYYTNDLHSYFAHWSQVATAIKMKRVNSEERGESSWLVDIGDHVDRMHPITEATMGKANVELMNELNYDFVTIGNNEGLTLAYSDLYNLYNDANFDVIVSNLRAINSEQPRWLKQSRIVTSKHGTRIAIIGLSAQFNPYYNLLGWHLDATFKVLQREIADLENKTDVIILLSHLGIYEDQTIANNFPKIDCIIGGHTHHLLRNGERVNQTIITAAGKQCEYVGEVNFTWDHHAQQLIHTEAFVTDVTNMHRDLRTEQRLQELTTIADVILNKTIIKTERRFEINWFKETEIMERFTETLRLWAKADIGMLNAGLLLDEFPVGEITYHDVHHICPHPINPCKVVLTGAELLEVVKDAHSRQLMELKLKGFGFRGEVIGRMIFANLEVETTFCDNGLEHLEMVRFQGEPIEEEGKYTLVTADTFTFGRLLPKIAEAKEKQLYLPEFLREILVKTLLQYKEK